MPFKRLFPLLVSILGILGLIACGTGIAAVWSVGSRLTRTNERVFDGIDVSLTAVRERVSGTQQQVQESKITAADIEQSLRSWTRTETSKRLESRLAIKEKAEQLALPLQQANLWLEFSDRSIKSIQQVLELGSSIGAPVDPLSFDPLAEKLASVRSQLQQANEMVDGISKRAADVAEGESSEDRMSQAVQLALRAVATLGEIDDRLGEFADKLSDTQAKGQHLKSRTRVYIVIAQIGAVLLIAWMAAGQICMCLHGWKIYRQQNCSG